MEKKKYVVVRCNDLKDFENRINEFYADGYELIQFDVVPHSEIMRGFYAVMEMPAPKRFNLDPAVSHG